ncbi:MAG: arylsulfatase [Gammaproteobacteria bacterium]|jgi:arylsulfatase
MKPTANTPIKSPNILWICTDQQRSDSLGCYGNTEVRSPNIDSLAASGVRFKRHITPMQICSPSRATMITGLYPRNHQLITNGRVLPESIPTITAALSSNGYHTHAVGKQHLQPILAPDELNMPDSRAFWKRPENAQWNGPFYGYKTIDLLIGESDTAQIAGHYAKWLKTNYPQYVDHLKPRHADTPPPEDLDEIWRSAMPVECHYNTWITDRSVDFIASQKNSESPFSLFVSFPDPHHPFDPPGEYADRYNPEDITLPTVTDSDLAGRPSYCDDLFPKGQGFRKLYWQADEGAEAGSTITTDEVSDEAMRMAIAYTHAQVEMIDDGVGRMLASLEENGMMDNTIVIFTSDHGEYLGSHGLLHKGPASYRNLTELSMIVKGPGIKAGLEIDSLTSHIDLTPTLLDLTDSGTIPNLDGISLKPLLDGSAASVRHYTFGEYHPTVRSDLYNQTLYQDQWRLTLYPHRSDLGELFNLEEDPLELNNLFSDPAMASIKSELSHRLLTEFPPQAKVDNKLLCKW